jgi:hypothetical protein
MELSNRNRRRFHVPRSIQTITIANHSKKKVSFTYDGHYRECSPHALGRKGEKVNVLVFQFGGATSKGPITQDGPNNWKCMDVAKIQGLELIEGDWYN